MTAQTYGKRGRQSTRMTLEMEQIAPVDFLDGFRWSSTTCNGNLAPHSSYRSCWFPEKPRPRHRRQPSIQFRRNQRHFLQIGIDRASQICRWHWFIFAKSYKLFHTFHIKTTQSLTTLFLKTMGKRAQKYPFVATSASETELCNMALSHR